MLEKSIELHEYKRGLIMQSRDFACPVTKEILDVDKSRIVQRYVGKYGFWFHTVVSLNGIEKTKGRNSGKYPIEVIEDLDQLKPRKVKVSESEYSVHRGEYNGLCLYCQEWTCGGVEPDAKNYQCEGCGHNTVMGADNVLVMELIEIE